MSVTDDLLEANAKYAETFAEAELSPVPTRHVAVVTCMDARMDIFALLGLGNGEAHVIRNAGGVVTDDVIRSLAISQRKLQSREVVLIHHTACGMATFGDDEFKAELEQETGLKPAWAVECFSDPYADTRQSLQRVRSSPFLADTTQIRGFVYDVKTGALTEVS
ncbi:carbonic anhydrase [Actinomycetospora corticicola]|uniref:carbonic anhydrase n=1 Tax=Actinomycetospora corticicola TaxID=663602 RepID=A0A7Y9DVQ8_9PSEU|nr:carbonic anhydrase [Actinomycetospora corticicola]NYD36403.1 carbonic anhydrase [Actinomycetospora corticicola]